MQRLGTVLTEGQHVIDDISVVMTTAHLGAVTVRAGCPELPMTCPDGRVRPWQLLKVMGAVAFHQPDFGLLRVKLSIPRLNYAPSSPWTYNFPLCPSPWSLDLDDVASQILGALGVSYDEDPVAKLGLLGAGVTKVAYAYDAKTSDGEETIIAVKRLRRSHARQAQDFYRPGQPPHAFQFEANDRRLMFYRKDEEVLAHIRPLRGRHREYGQLAKAVRDELVDQARNVVRIELTLKNTKSVRGVWGLSGGRLPTLKAMLREDVGSYLLNQELLETGLRSVDPRCHVRAHGVIDASGHPGGAVNVNVPEVHEETGAGRPPTDDGAGADKLVAHFTAVSASCRSFSEAGGVGASRSGRGIQGTRVLLLTVVSMLQGRLSDEKIRERCGGISDNAYRGTIKDLEAIGMPAGAKLDHLALLRRLVDEFDRQFPRVSGTLPGLNDDEVVLAPWADRLGFDHEDGVVGEDLMAEIEDLLVRDGQQTNTNRTPRSASASSHGQGSGPYPSQATPPGVNESKYDELSGLEVPIDGALSLQHGLDDDCPNDDYPNESGEVGGEEEDDPRRDDRDLEDDPRRDDSDDEDELDDPEDASPLLASSPRPPRAIPPDAPKIILDLVTARAGLGSPVDHYVLGRTEYVAFYAFCERMGWPYHEFDGAPTIQDRDKQSYLAAHRVGGGAPFML